MKKIISTLLIIVLLSGSISFSFAENSCNYSSEWEECVTINETNGDPWGIDPETDFLCISSTDHELILYNIVLHDKFRVIDEKVDKYLDDLQKNKDYYFGANRQKPYLEGIDNIVEYLWEDGPVYKMYYEECRGDKPDGILEETLACLGGITSVKNSKNFMSNSLCISLAKNKILVRRQVAADILYLNKQAVRKSEKKKYEQKQRSNFELVVDLFMVNLGYLLRISQKWASKTKNPY